MKNTIRIRSSLQWGSGVLFAALITGCNAVAGGASLAVVGAAAYFSWECYDHVAVTVRDMTTGSFTCDATVRVHSLDDPDTQWVIQPCYHVALSEGRWQLTAAQSGFRPMMTSVTIAPRTGQCPHHTHTVEMSLWPEGSAAGGGRGVLRTRQVKAPEATAAAGSSRVAPTPSRAFEISTTAPSAKPPKPQQVPPSAALPPVNSPPPSPPVPAAPTAP